MSMNFGLYDQSTELQSHPRTLLPTGVLKAETQVYLPTQSRFVAGVVPLGISSREDQARRLRLGKARRAHRVDSNVCMPEV